MNKARIKMAVWICAASIISLIVSVFGGNASSALNLTELKLSHYNNNIYNIYLNNKYINLVNIKNIIYINNKINKVSKTNKKSKIVYLVNFPISGKKIKFPDFSQKINLYSTTDIGIYISRIANGIKSVETGGPDAYTKKSYSSSACGAYQYMQVSWNNYMGYKNPCKAPSWVQDSKMINELKYDYQKYGDWEKVIAAHLAPSLAWNKALWNIKIGSNPSVWNYVKKVLKYSNITVNKPLKYCYKVNYANTSII